MKELKKLLKQSQWYLLVATLIFFLGSWLGYVFHDTFQLIIMQMLDELMEAAEEIGQNGVPLFASMFIFQNNLMAALMMLLLGSILFIIPAFSLFANGLAVGFVLQMGGAAGADVSPWGMFVYGILPHGILELPAIFLAGGIGIFLGFRLLGWLFGPNQFFSHLFGSARDDLGTFWKERTLPVLKSRAKGVGVLILLLAVVLFVAAMIEGFVTPVLLENFMADQV